MGIIKRWYERRLAYALKLAELHRSAAVELARECWRLRGELESALRENAALRAEQGKPEAATNPRFCPGYVAHGSSKLPCERCGGSQAAHDPSRSDCIGTGDVRFAKGVLDR
jgi:hypothetical protein